ncbi:HPP family protein [Paenibacillus anseongensis]|nr:MULTISPECIES: HPP family protein [Paenibacillus]
MNIQNESGFWQKMRTQNRSPLKVVPKNALIGSMGGFIAIALLAFLTDLTANAWIMAPFGATCVLAFGLWDAPLSQPRNIIGGHLISTLVGLIFFHLFGRGFWVMAIAVGLAIGLMMLTKTTHPPAGADPLVVILSGSSWSFLFTPVLIGSVLIVFIALIVNNLDKKRRYPTFWY